MESVQKLVERNKQPNRKKKKKAEHQEAIHKMNPNGNKPMKKPSYSPA